MRVWCLGGTQPAAGRPLREAWCQQGAALEDPNVPFVAMEGLRAKRSRCGGILRPPAAGSDDTQFEGDRRSPHSFLSPWEGGLPRSPREVG